MNKRNEDQGSNESGKSPYELTAEQFLDVMESPEFTSEGERQIVGFITDQEEARKLLEALVDRYRRA